MPTEQALDARTVVTLDADGSVDAEPGGQDGLEDPKWYPPALRSSPPGALPREHGLGIGLIEKAARTEVAEDAALNDTLEFEPVALVEPGRLVEADDPVRDLREDAKHHEPSPSGSVGNPGGRASEALAFMKRITP